MFDNVCSPVRCSPLVNLHMSRPLTPAGECHQTHRYPGVLQSLCCRDALGRVYGQHLVDEIFRFRSDRVPLRGGELPKQRDRGERLQGATEGAEAPLHLGWFSRNPLLLPMGQVGETVATGKSCQLENWRAEVEGERWKAQDKTYLSCKVGLKHASVCTWAWQLGQPCDQSRGKKLAPV